MTGNQSAHRGRGSGQQLTPYQGKDRCFGKFKCTKCNRLWMSGNSWANKGQECQLCEGLVYPFSQRELQKRDKDDDKIDPTKPHPMELCEMCQELGYPCTELSRASRAGGNY